MTSNEKNKILVLGAGMSGLGVAWRLAEKGVPVEVIEAQNEIGGLAATIRTGPYRLDYGPHFILSERPELLEKILSLFDEELPYFRRSAQLYFHGRFYNYPLTARNVLLQMPMTDAVLSAASYAFRVAEDFVLRAFSNRERNPNFAEWAKGSFGDYLFRLFFKPYTEQFWQIPVEKLSPDSMPTNTRLSFFKTLKLLFVKDIVKSSMSLVERETTLLLRYPRQGIGILPENMAREVESHGGRVHTGWKVTGVRLERGKAVVTAEKDGERRDFEGNRVVSTLPLTDLVRMLKPEAPAPVLESLEHLRFLSLIVVYLAIPNREILKSSYVYHLATPYNRIGDMNKFCPDLCPPDENMLALEFTCHQGDRLWRATKEELFERSIGHLERDGVLRRDEVRDIFVLKARHGYPVYLYEYKPHLQRVRDFVAGVPELEIVGRAGNYQYMDMDQCMHLGFEKAEKVIRGLKG